MDFGQSELLLPKTKELLEQNKIQISDLGLIIVCVGPGSFTGVRASVSAARAFSIALPDMPIAGVSAFEPYLKDFEPEDFADQNLVVIETKRSDFYYQIFDIKGNKVTDPSAGTREEIIELLKKNKKVSITGDAVERFLSSPTGLSFQAIKMPSSLSIINVAKVGIEQYENRRINFPKPLYLRAPDVCLK